ncbi:tetratricopeptide repeat protein [Nostoc ellipsosporum NOK]|jgi:tetratricopeptide (TPR) repeat protein|nr:tetratricopeptide repeat protein [Nostoc ellipsosporum NOK]
MSDKKNVQGVDSGEVAIARAKDFWQRNSKVISIVFIAVVLLGGGWFAYQNFVKKPKEQEASQKMFKAEEYWRMDSLNLALNGDGQNMGLLKVISRYDGTKAANLAKFMAGSAYVKLKDNDKAIKYLKDFDSDSKQVQARAYKLLGDAYGDKGNAAEAFDYYKKAAREFDGDAFSASDALFSAAYLAQRVLNKPDQAIELYKELKNKYPRTPAAYTVDTYLAQLGVYDVQ